MILGIRDSILLIKFVTVVLAYLVMDMQPKLGGVVKVRFYFGYKIDIIKDNGIKFNRSIQCNPKNDIMIQSFKIIQN